MKLLFRHRKQFSVITKNVWTLPQGTNSGINVYNCITRKKEPLVLRDINRITWYTCGPTVYDLSHIGHASCYVKLDIIQSILKKRFNFNLITVMNITDIDDKIISKSKENKINAIQLAKHYEQLFWKDLHLLGVKEPDIILRVTNNIDLVVEFIQQLINKGVAYQAQDNSVYFDVKKGYHNYGKLQKIGDSTTSTATFKKSPMDFALWKAKKEDEPCWPSPFGDGRPGWHVECSALATYALGSTIDIHSGGIDLRFPHHENEEALSCAFHGQEQWVNYWLHTGHLHLKDSEKMSKSLKNTVSVETMLESTTADAFRMACAMSHYRTAMEYGQEMLDSGANLLKTYLNFIKTCEDYKKGYIKADLDSKKMKAILDDAHTKIDKAFCNDFDMPTVISTLNELVSSTNSMLHSSASSKRNELAPIVEISNFVQKNLDFMNFQINERGKSNEAIEVLEAAMNFRHQVRNRALQDKNKDYLKLCDTFRDKLQEAGVSVRDYKKRSSFSSQ